MVEQITQDIRSLLNDQQRCVSVGDSMRLGVSRFQLASLLEEESSNDHRTTMRCETTKDVTDEGVPVTVFKMRSGGGNATNSMVYAITQMESLVASHERRLADLRDRSKDRRLVQMDPEGILPNPKFTSNAVDDNNHKDVAVASTSIEVDAPKASLLLQRPRKPTTAQNFFKKEGKENDKKKIATTTERKRPVQDTTKATTKKPPKGKTKASVEKTVGTVDDFKGDVDDDDDDSSVEAPRKPKSPKKKAKKAVTEEAPRKPKPVYDGPIAKQRRKVRKTRCTQDEKGYMVTEQYEEWEDVPSDEEAPPLVKVPPKKKPAVKAKASLKQGSLAGFFKKA